MVMNAGGANGAHGGETDFFGSSDAGNGTFVSEGGTGSGSFGGGQTRFFQTASAANGTLIADGGMTTSAFGGLIDFTESSTAGNATLIANGAPNGGLPGEIKFEGSSDGGTAHVQVFDDGFLDLTFHTAPGVTIGSIAGDGQVFLSIFNLTIGRGGFDSRFDGTISDTQGKGSLAKIGRGTLILTQGNNYSGGTVVQTGKLVVTNRRGSATGSGPVEVLGGTLAGNGVIAGAVTVGGSDQDALLSAGGRLHSPALLSIQGLLTFSAHAIFRCGLNSDFSVASEVVAGGVTITEGQFNLVDFGSSNLPIGTVFIVIDNSAAAPIAGTFPNLPDGSIVTVGSNRFEANYEGGDGNDLTLTVVP
jgi:autotransporter-associated beta strand protein